MHRDDLAGRSQDVVGDLIQELLLIEYEIVYEVIWQKTLAASMGMFVAQAVPVGAGRPLPCGLGVLTLADA